MKRARRGYPSLADTSDERSRSTLPEEFEAPPGDAFEASMDARVEPGVQGGRAATTSVLVGGSPVVSVSYTTRVMP